MSTLLEKCKKYYLDHQKQILMTTAATTTLFLLKSIKNYFSQVSVKDQYVLITGGSEGIGAALAEEVVKKNGKVILLARSSEKLAIIKTHLSKYSANVYTYAVDCSDFDAVEQVSKKIKLDHGVPFSIVNNAGAGVWKYLHETSKDEINSCLAAPYIAAINVTRAFLPEMIERNSGSISFVQSPAGLSAWGKATCYISARHALHGLYLALSADLIDSKIKVNEIVLGLTSSNYFKNNQDSYDSIPLFGRLLSTISPAQAASAILSQIESNKSGQTIYPLSLKIATLFKDFWPIQYAIIRSGNTVQIK